MYTESIDYLLTQLPMYQRSGATAMKIDLNHIEVLLDWLGNPERKLRCIHVGGTNGKGTVSHLLAAALQAQGLTVGMYTSPHYVDYRERIKVNGRFIPEKKVVDFVTRLRSEELPIQPSFFEITVAMAFDYFAQVNPDWCIIEVGLGGRLDSTNVIRPALSVITNIGFDHTQFLGDTLAAIAGEKAGIIKPHTPVVIGETQADTAPVFIQEAQSKKAGISFADQHWSLQKDQQNSDPQELTYHVSRDELVCPDKLTVKYGGPHQAKNLSTALESLHILSRENIQKFDWDSAFDSWYDISHSTHYIGRWQTLQTSPLVLADSAHNAEGLAPVMHRLKQFVTREDQLHIVLGVVNDKDLSKALPLFPKKARYYFVKANIPRGRDADSLQEIAMNFGLSGQAYASVSEGYTQALKNAKKDEVVFVGGSIFTVAEVLAL